MKLASADSKKLSTVRSSRQREAPDSGKQSVEISPLEVIRAMRTLEQQPQDDLSSFSQLPPAHDPKRKVERIITFGSILHDLFGYHAAIPTGFGRVSCSRSNLRGLNPIGNLRVSCLSISS